MIEYDFPDEDRIRYEPEKKEKIKKFVHPFGSNGNFIQRLLTGPNETHRKAEKIDPRKLLFWLFLTLFMVAISGVIIFGSGKKKDI